MHRVSVPVCLIALLLSFSKPMGSNPVIMEGNIFGGDYDDPSSGYQMPPSCEGKSFCFEKGTNYPQKDVEKLLNEMRPQDTLGSRIGFSFRDAYTENEDCPANTTYVDKPIYYIRDEMGVVRVVIQSPKFQQIYTARWCLNEGKITKDTPHFIPELNQFKKRPVECVTTNMDLDFIVMIDEGILGKTYKSAKAIGGIPVCCRCQYSN